MDADDDRCYYCESYGHSLRDCPKKDEPMPCDEEQDCLQNDERMSCDDDDYSKTVKSKSYLIIFVLFEKRTFWEMV